MVWTTLDVRLHHKLSNSFAFSFNPQYILIMGGIVKKQPSGDNAAAGTRENALSQKVFEQSANEVSKHFEINTEVYVLTISENHTKFRWKKLAPLPFKKKFANIVYNNAGKFFCYVLENNNKESPQLLVYDVQKIFPQFDQYHEYY